MKNAKEVILYLESVSEDIGVNLQALKAVTHKNAPTQRRFIRGLEDQKLRLDMLIHSLASAVDSKGNIKQSVLLPSGEQDLSHLPSALEG